jgi:hypothetical protein
VEKEGVKRLKNQINKDEYKAVRHSRESGNPVFSITSWAPAFAGATNPFISTIIFHIFKEGMRRKHNIFLAKISNKWENYPR